MGNREKEAYEFRSACSKSTWCICEILNELEIVQHPRFRGRNKNRFY
jgi:hypothetical protein